MIKKIFLIFATLVCLIVGVELALSYSARQFVNKTLPAVFKQWDVAEFKKHYISSQPQDLEQIDTQFFLWMQLGELERYKGAARSSFGRMLSSHRRFLVDATFQDGQTTFTVDIVRKAAGWKITSLTLNFSSQDNFQNKFAVQEESEALPEEEIENQSDAGKAIGKDEPLPQESSELLKGPLPQVEPQQAEYLPARYEIILVPIGHPDPLILKELRAVLQDKMGIAVSIAKENIELGTPDRNGAEFFVEEFYKNLKERLSPLQQRFLFSTAKLTEPLKSFEDQKKFAERFIKISGPRGRRVEKYFNQALEDFQGKKHYSVDRLTMEIAKIFHQTEANFTVYMGVTPQDIFMDGNSFVFGGSIFNYSVISYHGFTSGENQTPASHRLLMERLLKQAISSANLAFLIPRCSTPHCVRAYPRSLSELDAKPNEFCPICKTSLDALKQNPYSWGNYLWLTDENIEKSVEYCNKGLELHNQGRTHEAIEEFKKAQKEYILLYEVYTGLGLAYADEGLWEESLDNFRMAVLLQPENATAWSDVGYTHYRMKQHTEALKYYQEALAIDPSMALTHYNKSLAHFKLEQFNEAIQEFDEAVGLGYQPNPEYKEKLAKHRLTPG